MQDCPALTVPQYLALALGRHPDAFGADHHAAILSALSLRNRAVGVTWTLVSHSRTWAYSHRDADVDLDWWAVRRRRTHAGDPLTELSAWWPADRPVPARLVALGLCSRTRPARRHCAKVYWQRARAAGLVRAWRPRTTPAYALSLTARSNADRTHVHTPSLAHHCVAVEAALALHFAQADAPAIERLIGDSAMARETSRGHRDSADRPDLELHRGGGTVRVEVISADYSAADLDAKAPLLALGTKFVGTTRRTAARTSARLSIPCWHA